MPNKGAFADFIDAWGKMSSNAVRNAAELPAFIQDFAVPLVEVVDALREIAAVRQDRRSIKQLETKNSAELLDRGRKLAEKLRNVLIAHHGPESERLVAYDIPVRRTRKSRKAQPETPQPEDPGAESPTEAKTAPQGGGTSKPAEPVTEGQAATQAAEGPKPGNPAPATPEVQPAPQSKSS